MPPYIFIVINDGTVHPFTGGIRSVKLIPKLLVLFNHWHIKGKAIPVTGRGDVRRRGSHIFYTICSQMVVRLSALQAGHPLATRMIPGTHFC
jgi:hypothetical protein